jgi:hypothetical protein
MSTDAGSEGRTDQDREGVSEEDVRRLVEQLRSAPAEPIIADTFSTLLNTAQVKLGRRDARLFIDLCSVMLKYADRYVSEDLGKQVERALGQLRLGQVSAENEVAKQEEPEPNDLSRVPAPPATSGQAEAPVRESTSSKSKLWVPGH